MEFRPQKADTNQLRITVGGNLITYPREFTTKSANVTISKFVWNIVLSIECATFPGIDIKNVYLGTPLTKYKYKYSPLNLPPLPIAEHTQDYSWPSPSRHHCQQLTTLDAKASRVL